jgi:hypothetical protein
LATITLYCGETPGLRLGPGIGPAVLAAQGEEHLKALGQIQFSGGYAVFDPSDYPDWKKWVDHPGSPKILILDGEDGEVPSGADTFVCEICGRSFKSVESRRGHLRVHVTASANN